MKILDKKELREIENKLNKQFGVNEIPGTLIVSGKNKLFLFSGDLNQNQISSFQRTLPVERIGAYFGKVDERSSSIRLSIEGSQILGDQISKNVFSLNPQQTDDWMKGRELLIKTGKKDFLVMKNNGDFLGTGKASEEKIGNFVPKNRRLKNQTF